MMKHIKKEMQNIKVIILSRSAINTESNVM